MDVRFVSTLWLLWITLLRTFLYKFLCARMCSCLLDTDLGVKFLGHRLTLKLTIYEAPSFFPQLPYYFVCPPAVHKGPSFSTSSQTLVLTCLFDDGHPRGSEVAPHCGFDSHFPEGRRNGSWKKSVKLTKTKIRRKYRERKRYPGCKHKNQSWLKNWPRHRAQWAGQCSLETAFLGFGSDVDAHGAEVAVLHEKVRMYLCCSSFSHNQFIWKKWPKAVSVFQSSLGALTVPTYSLPRAPCYGHPCPFVIDFAFFLHLERLLLSSLAIQISALILGDSQPTCPGRPFWPLGQHWQVAF